MLIYGSIDDGIGRVDSGLRSCRKITNASCAGYFFENVCQKTQCSGLRRGFLACIIGEIDKSRCVSYFSTDP